MSRRAIQAALAVGLALAPATASAVGFIRIDDDHYVTVSLGLKLSVDENWTAPPAHTDFNLDLAVVGIGGQLTRWLRAQANIVRDPAGHIDLLDAIAEIEPSPYVRLWVGQLLPPSDRLTFSGPFFTDTWTPPFVVPYSTGVVAGRDLGASLWGEIGGGTFKYQLGAFKGRTIVGAVNPNLEYTGRLVWNAWDPEPGYYNSDSYYGEKQLLSVGIGARRQEDGAGTPGHTGAMQGENVDLLLERRLGDAGVATIEAAVYRLDLGGVTDPTLAAGNSGMALAAYLLPWYVGPGRFQPTCRFEALILDTGGTHRRWDAGLNYIILGHNAQIDAVVALDEPPGTHSYAVTATLGAQIIL